MASNSDPMNSPDFAARARMASQRNAGRIERRGGSGTAEFSVFDQYPDQMLDNDISRPRGLPVTFVAPVQASAGQDNSVVLCRTTAEHDGEVGMVPVETLAVMSDGNYRTTGTGRLVLAEAALGWSLPAGTMIVGHRMMLAGFEAIEVDDEEEESDGGSK